MQTKVHIQSTSAVFVWRALQNVAIADFEDNVEEMVGMTRKRRVATESGGTRPGTSTAVPGTRPATAGDE